MRNEKEQPMLLLRFRPEEETCMMSVDEGTEDDWLDFVKEASQYRREKEEQERKHHNKKILIKGLGTVAGNTVFEVIERYKQRYGVVENIPDLFEGLNDEDMDQLPEYQTRLAEIIGKHTTSLREATELLKLDKEIKKYVE